MPGQDAYYNNFSRHEIKIFYVLRGAFKISCRFSLDQTSDLNDVNGIVSGIGIAKTLRTSGNQNDVSR